VPDRRLLFVFVVLLSLSAVGTRAAEGTAKAPNKHIITWQAFAENTLALHRKLIRQGPVEEKTKLGGYEGLPDFYIEKSYYDAKTHHLISQLQWEKANPKQLHTIVVYLYDDKGRVTRDFTAAYLPYYHKAPTQTLISLHHYIDELHAFRTFDASGYRIDEGCRGSYQGKDVEILLDEDEIAEGSPDMQSAVYKLCFEGVPLKAGKYLIPQ
jgi:hypothetical protein